MDIIWFVLALLSLAVIYVLIYGMTPSGKKYFNVSEKKNPARHTKATKKAMKKIMQLLEEKGQIQNDDVENLLEVSDSTATRYLDRLQETGEIEQVGDQGRGVYYQKTEK